MHVAIGVCCFVYGTFPCLLEFYWHILSGCQVCDWGIQCIQYHLCSTFRGLWGVWLSRLSGRALAAQARGVLGLTPGGCWPFHFPLFSPHNMQLSSLAYISSAIVKYGIQVIKSCFSINQNKLCRTVYYHIQVLYVGIPRVAISGMKPFTAHSTLVTK